MWLDARTLAAPAANQPSPMPHPSRLSMGGAAHHQLMRVRIAVFWGVRGLWREPFLALPPSHSGDLCACMLAVSSWSLRGFCRFFQFVYNVAQIVLCSYMVIAALLAFKKRNMSLLCNDFIQDDAGATAECRDALCRVPCAGVPCAVCPRVAQCRVPCAVFCVHRAFCV